MLLSSAEPAKVDPLRYALIGAVALSVLSGAYPLIALHSWLSYYGTRFIVTALINFALLQAPHIALLIAILRSLGKYVVAFAMALPCAFVLHSIYVLVYLRHLLGAYMPRIFLTSTAVGLALEIVVFVFALQLKEQLGQHGRSSLLAVAGVVSVSYMAAITWLANYVPAWVYR